jgi:hypothetical protein
MEDRDREYCLALGQAIFAFAGLEYGVVWIMEKLRPSYINNEYRAKNKTARDVARDLGDALHLFPTKPGANPQIIHDLHARFDQLAKDRNKLLHANPATDHDGAQILIQQSFERYIRWNLAEVLSARTNFESASITAWQIVQLT